MYHITLNLMSASNLNIHNFVHMPNLSGAAPKSEKSASKSMQHKLSYRGAFFMAVSLLFVFLLVSSSVVSMFSGVSLFVSGAESIQVGTESALREAVDNAKAGEPITIAFTNDIILESCLVISDSKTITLTSAGGTGFFRLVSLDSASAIAIYESATLTIDGIIVTHETGYGGRGIFISTWGKLVMLDGAISGNTMVDTSDFGGGVEIRPTGIFELVGGVISDNTAENGGGVHSDGVFSMSGGKISNNQAIKLNPSENFGFGGRGGGVYMSDYGSFTMTNGEISNNTANFGGGVYMRYSSFSMSGGKISNNQVTNQTATLNDIYQYGTAGLGGGVFSEGPWGGSFTLSGGEISGNTAVCGGGVSGWGTDFSMSGGTITNNTATYLGGGSGGGVHMFRGSFSMSGGTITNNLAANGNAGVGGGVFMIQGSFILSNGLIAYNRAGSAGGGAYVFFSDFSMSGGTITNNIARDGGGVFMGVGSFTMSGGVIANHTVVSVGGGVVVDDDGVFELVGGVISGNTARGNIGGGGVYVAAGGSAVLLDGVISGNVATTNGGGVWITSTNNVADFERLYVGETVVFSNNVARAAYNRDAIHNAVYGKQIYGTTWSAPFTQGYNNYDISYTYGSPTDGSGNTGGSGGSGGSGGGSSNGSGSGGGSSNNKPSPSVPLPSKPVPSTPRPSPSVGGGADGDSKDVWSIGGVVLAVIVGLIVGVIAAVALVVVLLQRRSRV